MTAKPRRIDQIPEHKLRMIFDKCIKNEECLEWTGNYFKNKRRPNWRYPYIYFRNKVWRGNRLVLFLISGDVPEKMNALHTCDNNKCLNPKHLYWGTQKQNVIDAITRGRQNIKRGNDGKYQKLS